MLYFWFKLQSSAKTVGKHTEQGLTLVETLAAILTIAIVITVSTPPILLAVATRIQTRRAERAMQIAQEQIERIRILVEQGEYENSDLPPAASGISDPDSINTVDAPGSICPSCNANSYPSSITEAFEQIEQNQQNFLVQVFREPGVSQTVDGTSQVVAFRMGVRVYSPAAQLGSLNTTPASLQITSGLGEQQQSPLAVLYADLVRGDLTGSLDSYRQFLED